MAASKKTSVKAASSNGKNPAANTATKNGSTTNGKAKAPSPKQSPPSTSGLSVPAKLACLAVAVLSLAAGILTPPLSSSLKARRIKMRKLSRAAHRRAQEAASGPTPVKCDANNLAEFLHDEPVVGMHLLCFSNQGNKLELYPYLHEKFAKPLEFSKDWNDFRTSLEAALHITKSPTKPTWAIFTREGHNIVTDTPTGIDGRIVIPKLVQHGMVVLMEGGQWVWPGVRVGFRRTVDLSRIPGKEDMTLPAHNATIETLSLSPLVVSVEGFLTEDECDFVQEEATPRFQYSQVSLQDKDKGRPSSDFRTSQSCFLALKHPTLDGIDYRTASLVRIPRSHQEQVQVLRYGLNEHYSAHTDYFDPALYKNDPGTLATIQHGKRNRLATVFWYLSNVTSGGETNFPLSDDLPYPSTLDKCIQGLKVKPVRGRVIIFYSLLANGAPDPKSLHAACSVEEGIKFAANKWVWNAPMGYIRDA